MRTRHLFLALTAVVGFGATSALVSASGLSADDQLSTSAGAIQRAERLEAPVDLLPDRPRVFMAFHGTNRLADDSSLDSQWSFVQDNLDGLWGNSAGISWAQIARFTRKVETRQLIAESDFRSGNFNVQTFMQVTRDHPDVEFEREAITFYTDNPASWNGDTIEEAHRVVDRANYGGAEPFQGVITGWQPQNFYTEFVRQYPPIPGGSDAERAVFEGDGIFVECPHDVCNGVEYEDGFFRAMRIARATDQPFVWLSSRLPGQPQSGWLAEFQTMYNRVTSEGLWRPGDIVVLIAYNGQYPLVPESNPNGSPADTLTGLAYWALNR